MGLITREELPGFLDTVKQGNTTPVYLFFGERFLCQNAAERLQNILLQQGGTVHPIDGSQEDMGATVSKLRSFSILPGRQIYRVSDTRLFLSKNIGPSLWKRAEQAWQANKLQAASRWLHALMQTAGLDPNEAENSLNAMSKTGWRKVFGFAKPAEDLGWTEQVLQEFSQEKSFDAGKQDAATVLQETLKAGIPPNNFLLLLSEEVDKRTKIYKFIKEYYSVIDLSVAAGSSAGAQKAQKHVLQELVNEQLQKNNKTLAPGVADLLFERVGFHPVAAVMEIEKLILASGDKQRIDRDDLDALVGRTRQEAVFELTDALGKKNLEQCLLVGHRLQENGMHPLAIVAALRNYARKLLLFRSLLEQPEYGYQAGITPALFQSRCLPKLKESELWKTELSGHPYALFMQFKTAATFPLIQLQSWFTHLLATEMRLKGSPIDAALLLDHLLCSMIAPTPDKYH